jgi:MscS family membrane protein
MRIEALGSRRRRTGIGRVAVAALLAATLGALAVSRVAAADASRVEEARDDTPRGAVLGYLEAGRAADWRRAAAYLDLRGVFPERRATMGPRLAQHLKAVLDRELWVDVDALSDAPEGERDDGLPPSVDRVGTIKAKDGPVDVLVARVEAPAGPVWRIAKSTVAEIPALYDQFGYGPLADYLPAVFFEIRFLEIQLWQWIGLAAVLVLAVLLASLATAVATRLLAGVARRSRTTLDDELLPLLGGPLRLVLGTLVVLAAAGALALAQPVYQLIVRVAQAVELVALTWLLLRAVDVLAGQTETSFLRRNDRAAVSVIPLGRRTVKVALGALAVVAVLQNLGFNVTGLLAGLGVAGIAVALAAQKTLENFFGGITLIADRPVQVGDFCRFGDRVGTIEDIGLRTTRVRTLDRTVVSIPNSQFASLQLENFARRDRIWLSTTLGLRYETTPDQLRHVLVELKRLLLAHPKVTPDPARIRFAGFGAYSLDLEIFAYVDTADINEFLAIREDVFLRIMDVVQASGTGFAFPSQTLYTAPDAGLDEARRRAAEDEVRQWRAERRLHLPDPPPEVAAELRATLDYPPQGSPERG